jgi:hypothetical protein
LRFSRHGARSYRLQFHEALTNDSAFNWRELMEFPAETNPSIGEFRDLTSTNATRLYRVVTP